MLLDLSKGEFMADYYYAEMLFNPDKDSFADVIEGSVKALINSGCEFTEIIIPRQRFTKEIKWGEFSSAGIENLREMCDAVMHHSSQQGLKVISFPPGWGRVMFKYDFNFDEQLSDEIWDEEEETNALSTDVGASFTYSPAGNLSEYIKITISFWEDFVLRGGRTATHIVNLNRILGFWESISRTLSPYFGVMNRELHINSDASYDLLCAGKLPEGNEYVYIGKQSLRFLNATALKSSGRPYRAIGDDSVLIELTDRWAPGSAIQR